MSLYSANGSIYKIGGGGLASTSSGSPLSLPLVTSSTPFLTYLGEFQGPTDNSFAYGGGALSITGNSPGVLGNLYCSGYQAGSSPQIGELKIPSPTGPGGTYVGTETATTVVTGNTTVAAINTVSGTGPNVITGSLAYGGKLYLTGALQFDSGATAQTGFLVGGNTNITGFGNAAAVNSPVSSINRIFANGMNTVPSIWQSLLGGPVYGFGGPAGMTGISIISNMCCGYGLWTLDPSTYTSGGTININKEWISYPYTNIPGQPQQVSVLWGYDQTTQSNWSGVPGDNYITEYDCPVGCGFIVPGSRTYLTIHSHVYGPENAGRGSSPCDPGGSSSGAFDTPISPDTLPYRRLQFSAYDLAAVISSRNGGALPSAARPYAWWEVPNWATIFGQCFTNSLIGMAWATYDYANNLLYCAQSGFSSSNGSFQVFQITPL